LFGGFDQQQIGFVLERMNRAQLWMRLLSVP